METYTAEQLAEMEKLYRDITQCREHSGEHLHSEEYLKILNLNRTISDLQSEVEKYRKAFEEAKKERDFQVAEYQEKIKEMTDRAILEFPTEPIDVANFLINGLGASWHYDSFDVSELRQIAEHLLVYCNHNKEEEE